MQIVYNSLVEFGEAIFTKVIRMTLIYALFAHIRYELGVFVSIIVRKLPHRCSYYPLNIDRGWVIVANQKAHSGALCLLCSWSQTTTLTT